MARRTAIVVLPRASGPEDHQVLPRVVVDDIGLAPAGDDLSDGNRRSGR